MSAMNSSVPALRALETAAEGLAYPSETDAPVTAFAWTQQDAPTAAALLSMHALSHETKVETTSLRDELGPLADDDGDDAPRWKTLVEVVERELREVVVYRLGAPDVLIVVVGHTEEGAFFGLETRAVET